MHRWLLMLALCTFAILGSTAGPCGNVNDDSLSESNRAPLPPPIYTVPAAAPPAEEPLVLVGKSPAASVGEITFDVEVAFTSEDRIRGLSGRRSLSELEGMLFVFDSGRASGFWMKGMTFALDFVWIDDDCTVVDLHESIRQPSPGALESDLPRYSSREPARYTLEIMAGSVADFDIRVGDRVRFHGISGRGAVC